MSIFESIFLGAIQGVTEFFPISSSGHLVLFQNFLGLQPIEQAFFNILVHAGTLLAILIYFREKLIDLIKGIFQKEPQSIKLFLNLIISTLPIVFVGLLFEDKVSQIFSTPNTVALSMLATALFFIVGEQVSKNKTNQALTHLKALIIGIVQSIAVIPGVSRSGSTLIAGLLTGLDREKSAEYSFLIAIPAISGAVVLSVLKVLTEPSSQTLQTLPLLAGFLTAFLTGFLSIKFLMQLYKKHSLNGFAAYLIIVSVVLLAI